MSEPLKTRVHRVEKKGGFIMIANATATDDALSYSARGLLLKVLSLPANFEHSAERLTTEQDGRDAVRTSLGELKRRGYARVLRERGERGRVRYVWEFSETPREDWIPAPSSGNPTSDDPTLAAPSSDAPTSDNPTTHKDGSNKNGSKKDGNNKYVVGTAVPSSPAKVVKSDDEWLAELSLDAAYAGIEVMVEWAKMSRWCEVNSRRPTRKRFINWLNRAEGPMTGARGSGQVAAYPIQPGMSPDDPIVLRRTAF